MSIFKKKELEKARLQPVNSRVQLTRSEPVTVPPIAVVESKLFGLKEKTDQ